MYQVQRRATDRDTYVKIRSNVFVLPMLLKKGVHLPAWLHTITITLHRK
jgi:hypothetical protein